MSSRRPVPFSGAFLTDSEGIVCYSVVGANPSDRPELGEIMDAIEAVS